MTAVFTPASELLGEWQGGLVSGTPPTLYPVAEAGNALSRIEIGPGLVTLFGGSPGAGKTALVMQLVVDALRLTPTLKALVANVEMPPTALLDRQLARLSGIDLPTIRHRKLAPEHQERLTVGLTAVTGFAPRLAFARAPFSLDNIALSADAFGADVLVLDYLQRITPPGEHAYRKAAVDAAMEYVRGFADAGVAVIAVAAVGRQKDDKGRNGYSGLNLASFRESSELEYGADDAFLLVRESDDSDAVTLKHVKSRYGEPCDLTLQFTGRVQRFDPIEPADTGKLTGAVRDVWGRQTGDTEGGEW